MEEERNIRFFLEYKKNWRPMAWFSVFLFTFASWNENKNLVWRKNIKNNFIVSPYINIEKDKIDEILEKANIDKNDRGESLSLEEVKKISNIIKDIFD